MATGFAPFLLKHIAEVTKENAPQYKIEPAGFLNLLKRQGSAPIVRVGNEQGHKKTVTIKKKTRAILADTDTTASCDNVLVPAYTEDTVTADVYRQIGLYIDDETIAQYMEDASRTIAVGQPATPLMNEFVDSVRSHASAIIEGIDRDLLTKMAAAFGVNRRTGSSASSTINIELTTTNNPLNDGVTQILADFKNNGGSGRPQVFGSGLMYNYVLQQFAKGMDQAGIDSKVMAGAMDFFHDLNASSILGANQIGVIEPNAVQLVEYMKYKGFKAGNFGVSTFGTLALPMMTASDILPIEFDFQLKYIDCPTDLVDAYSGATISAEKGWSLIISKTCGLYTIPSTAYKTGDPLDGNRGSLRYTITNA